MNKPMHTNLRNFVLSCLATLLGLAPALASPVTVDRVVVVVGMQVITQRQWDERLAQVQQQNANRQLPADLDEQVLEALVVERAQVQAALDMGVRVSESEVDQAEQRIAAQNGLELSVFQQQMQRQGVNLIGFRANLRDQLLIEQAKERIVNERVKITPGAVQDYVQRNAQRFPAVLNLAHILVPVAESASADERSATRLQAQRLVERARAGEDFAALGAGLRGLPSAHRGEAVGLKPETEYPPLFVQATQGRPIGYVSEPVQSGAGYHILKVLQREASRLTVAEPQVHARHILLRVRTMAERQAAIDQLRKWRADILAGRADFAELAKKHSQDGSAAIGGDLGWASAGYFVPEFEAAVDALRDGAIAEPLVTRFGVHLVQVLERRQSLMDEVALQEWAKKQMRAEQGAEWIAAWVREVRAAAYVRRMDAR